MFVMTRPTAIKIASRLYCAGLGAGCSALALLLSTTQAVAQSPAPVSQSQLRTSQPSQILSEAMSKLAVEPRNLDALLKAGEAALELDDPRSAMGFFGRADDISANNGRVKAGLGRSMLQLEQIGDGLRLMEQAGNLGYSDAGLLADRGLARDLTGNQRGAQQDYDAALRLDPGNETVIRRRAVSYGISGQLDQAQAMLQPLLFKSDRAAWRDKAFILAMNGRTAEALDITQQVMPKTLADAIKPYMERMAMLTPGQRAAAVHMGQFPPGLVNMRIASPSVPVKTASATVSPAKAAKAAKKPKIDRTSAPARAATQVAAAQPAPAPQTRAAPPAQTKPKNLLPSRQVQGPAVPPELKADRRASSAPNPTPPPARPVSAQQAAVPATQPAAPGESDRSLADIMSEIKIPASERRNDVAPVNLAEIAAIHAAERKAREAEEAKARKEEARRKAEAAAKAKAEAERKRLADNPARYFVQMGVGRNQSAHAFTVRRIKGEYSAVAKYDAWWAQMGQTKRIVFGPFSNLAKAKEVETAVRKAGSDGYVWRSDAGEVVEKIGE
ncbi:MAG: SPOR domain-containing protein [Sphingobium sp.]